MRLLDRYIRNQVVWSTAVVVLILVGVESFLEFIGQLSDIGTANYGVMQTLIFVPLQLPTDLYQLFPMAGFLGCIIGLGQLASSSQLIVMRSSGVSIARISWSVIKTAVFMIIVVTAVGEWVAPKMQLTADYLKMRALNQVLGVSSLPSVWLRKNNQFIQIGNVTSPTEISHITTFTFNPKLQLQTTAYSPKGVFAEDHWVLLQSEQSMLKANQVLAKKLYDVPLHVLFQPTLMQKSQQEVDQQSITSLMKNIWYRKQTGLMTTQYVYSFWMRLIQPITTILMICLGIPFVFGSLRAATMGSRILVGVVIGFTFYTLNQFFGPITLVYQFPPFWAAMLPTMFFLVIYVVMLFRIR